MEQPLWEFNSLAGPSHHGRKRPSVQAAFHPAARTRLGAGTSSAGPSTPDFTDDALSGLAVGPIHVLRRQEVSNNALAWRDEAILVARVDHRDQFLKHGTKSVEAKWDAIGVIIEKELNDQRARQNDGLEAEAVSDGGIPEQVRAPEPPYEEGWLSGKRLYDRVRRLDAKTKEVRYKRQSHPEIPLLPHLSPRAPIPLHTIQLIDQHGGRELLQRATLPNVYDVDVKKYALFTRSKRAFAAWWSHCRAARHLAPISGVVAVEEEGSTPQAPPGACTALAPALITTYYQHLTTLWALCLDSCACAQGQPCRA